MPPLEQIETLYHQALLIDGVVARRQWLADRCGADKGLLAEVESLLDAHAAMVADSGSTPAAEPAIPTELFGAYRAVRFLGRGGMSAVYLAERTDGRFDQTVAIKLMAAHLAGDDFQRRFETEGQFLAALRHPNITNLLDAGVSSSGHPFLAMEYVEGATFDEYCDRRKLSIERRLRLFLQVAGAVEYAHRNLILHRDLKPGNILVTNDGQVKLLDFGTASLLTGTTPVTVTRGRMLTPRYASPEQLRGQRPGVGGDVFSLGVILYELLTGAWPFGDPESVVVELKRAAGEISPTRPTAAVTQPAAERRSLSRDRLRRVLGGDLCAIMLKALENEPARRYATVREFSADLQHYLDGLPVEARPQTSVYRFSKFVRRRWFAVAAASIFVTAISAAAIVATLEARAARAEALKADQVNRFLNQMLDANDANDSDVGKSTVEQMLEAADRRLQHAQDLGKDGKLNQQSIGGPLTLAILHKSLAASYYAQQRYDKVRFHLDRAIPALRTAGDERELAGALGLQAMMERDLGHYPQADRIYKETLAYYRRMGTGAASGEIFETERQYAQLLTLYMGTRVEEARKLYDDLLALGARDQSIPRVDLATAMANRGSMLQGEGKLPEAEAATLEALAIGRREDTGGMWEFDPLFTLTIIYGREHKYQEGKEAAQKMIDLNLRALGPDSLPTAQARIIWAPFAAETGEAAAAGTVVRQSMRVIEKAIQSPSLNLWFAARNASNVMRLAGLYDEAERYGRQSLAVAQAAHLTDKDPRAASSWEALGRALCEKRKYAEAIQALETAEAIYRRAGSTWVERAGEMHTLIEAARRNLQPS